MSKVKYYYDSETLSYRKVEKRKRNTAKKLGFFLLASALFGFLFFNVASQFYESPKERKLTREKEFLELQLGDMSREITQLQTVIANVEQRDNAIYRIYFDATPIPQEQRESGFGGVNRYKNLEGFPDSDKVIAMQESRYGFYGTTRHSSFCYW